MRRIKTAASFQQKIICMTLLLILLPVFVITVQQYRYSRAILESSVEQNVQDTLSMSLEQVEDSVEQLEDITLSVIGNTQLQELLYEEDYEEPERYESYQNGKNIQKVLSSYAMIREEIQAITIVGKNEEIYEYQKNSTALRYPEEILSAAEEKQGKTVWMTGEKGAGYLYLAREINHLTSQSDLGCLIVMIGEPYIYQLFGTTRLAGQGELVLVNEENKIVSQKDKTGIGETIQPELMGMKEKEFLKTESGGEVYYVYASGSLENGWRLMVSVLSDVYFSNIRNLRNNFLMISVLMTLFAVLLAVGITKSLTMPLLELSRAMEQFGKGNLEIKCNIETQDEVGRLNQVFNTMANDINDLVQNVYEQQILTQEAELKSLQMQINPHFLYNTLDTINWMARMKGNEDVGDMAAALGNLMRFTLSKNVFITVEEEVRSLQNYLSIQQQRYCDKLFIKMDIPKELYPLYIPKLLIQPMVENAIVHGIEEKIEAGTVTISARRKEEELYVYVTDDGVGMSHEAIEKIMSSSSEVKNSSHTLIGIFNVNRRIQMYYGKEYGLQVQSKLGEGTRITLRLKAYAENPEEKLKK